ncbi:MAG: hypothetical protein Q4C09_04685, partial [Atopobiaceae bacterium]|nr:hypothetical protein [Atopobiaceae bacterium]
MELIPLVEEGDYDIGAFESAQYDYFGTWPYVLVKRDGILYAFHDTSNEGFGGTKPTEKGGSSERGLQSPTQTPTSTQTST